MTDLEICKRIAEIEGDTWTLENFAFYDDEQFQTPFYLKQKERVLFGSIKNPLADDALCFQLMVKYKVSLLDEHYNGICDKWVAEIHHSNEKYGVDKSPNKAICLAIIEAHKD